MVSKKQKEFCDVTELALSKSIPQVDKARMCVEYQFSESERKAMEKVEITNEGCHARITFAKGHIYTPDGNYHEEISVDESGRIVVVIETEDD